ncbi:MAG: hypothetical protein JXQ87_04310 [Bacteroidia bacterium]
MSKQRFLSFSVVVLIITNVSVLLFFVINNPSHGHIKPTRENPKEIIIEKLAFDKNQIIEYEAAIAIHRFEIEEQEMKIRELKHKLYEGLAGNGNKKEELISELANAQRKIEQIHYQHFEEIKAICNDNQKDEFNALSNDLAKIFAPKPPKHHSPKSMRH